MNQIQMWQLLVDIGLITSVLTMTTKAFKSSRLSSMLPKTRELESSLRTLIGDAEAAGLQLNDQLLRREQNIQKALSEIQQSEARIVKAIADAEALQGKLQVTRAETVRVIQDLKQGFEQGVQSERSRLEERTAAAYESVPQAPRQTQSAPPSYAARHDERERGQESEDTTFVAQSYGRSPLQQRVEVVQSPSRPLQREASVPSHQAAAQNAGTPTSAADLQRVYQSAEAMIKEGRAVESVASQMKLPVEGVKLLAQMIEIEREEDSKKQDESGRLASADSRLGALGPIRRQTSAL